MLGQRRLGVVEVGNFNDRGWGSSRIAGTLDLEDGDYDVAVPDLAVMEVIGPHPDLSDPLSVASQGITEDGSERDEVRP